MPQGPKGREPAPPAAARSGAPAGRPRKPCPICGRPSSAEAMPFCSDRCREVDLGRWLSGSYVIPARDDADEDAE